MLDSLLLDVNNLKRGFLRTEKCRHISSVSKFYIDGFRLNLARPRVTATNTRSAVSKSVGECVTSHLSYRHGKIKILWLTNFDLSNVHKCQTSWNVH